MEYLDNLSDRIKSIRKDLNLSGEKFAEAIGFSSNAVGNAERRHTIPSIKMLSAIRERFGFSLEWIVTGNGPIYHVDIPHKHGESLSGELNKPTSLINSDTFKEIQTIRIPGINSEDKAVQIQGEELDPHVRKSDIIVFSNKSLNVIKNNQIVLLRSNKTGYHIGQIYFSEARLSIELRQINPAYRSVQALEISEITESYVAEYKVSRAILEPVVDVHEKLAKIDDRLTRIDSKL